MRFFVLLLALLLGVGFVFVNWGAITTPVDVDLMLATAKAPLGVIIIAWFGVLFVIVAYGMLVQQATALGTARNLTKALEEQKRLASSAEDSRLNDVKSSFESKWKQIADQEKQLLQDTDAKIKDKHTELLGNFKDILAKTEQSNQELAKSVSAALDTMDDKISKVLIAAQAKVDQAIANQKADQKS
ncbi:MAG: LapA family protein [Burkholderiales bacterium]|nr:LapA family protein [Burkholderiales bacterium]